MIITQFHAQLLILVRVIKVKKKNNLKRNSYVSGYISGYYLDKYPDTLKFSPVKKKKKKKLFFYIDMCYRIFHSIC